MVYIDYVSLMGFFRNFVISLGLAVLFSATASTPVSSQEIELNLRLPRTAKAAKALPPDKEEFKLGIAEISDYPDFFYESCLVQHNFYHYNRFNFNDVQSESIWQPSGWDIMEGYMCGTEKFVDAIIETGKYYLYDQGLMKKEVKKPDGYEQLLPVLTRFIKKCGEPETFKDEETGKINISRDQKICYANAQLEETLSYATDLPIRLQEPIDFILMVAYALHNFQLKLKEIDEDHIYLTTYYSSKQRSGPLSSEREGARRYKHLAIGLESTSYLNYIIHTTIMFRKDPYTIGGNSHIELPHEINIGWDLKRITGGNPEFYIRKSFDLPHGQLHIGSNKPKSGDDEFLIYFKSNTINF